MCEANSSTPTLKPGTGTTGTDIDNQIDSNAHLKDGKVSELSPITLISMCPKQAQTHGRGNILGQQVELTQSLCTLT